MSAQSIAFDLSGIILSVAGGVIAFVAFIGRKTFTNEKQVAVIQESLHRAEEERKVNNKRMEDNFHEMRDDIKSLIAKTRD